MARKQLNYTREHIPSNLASRDQTSAVQLFTNVVNPDGIENLEPQQNKARNKTASDLANDAKHNDNLMQYHRATASDPDISDVSEKTSTVVNDIAAKTNRRQPEGRGFSPEEYLGEKLDDFRTFEVESGEAVEHAKLYADYKHGRIVLAHRLDLRVIPEDVLKDLDESVRALADLKWLKFEWEHQRGVFGAVHICLWKRACQYDTPFYNTDACGGKVANEIHPSIQHFLDRNKRLWTLIENLIKNHFPADYAILSSARRYVKQKYKKNFLCGLFPGLAVNLNCQTTRHKDCTDSPYGICVVVCYGEFDQGELVLEEVESIFEFPSGSIIVVRSAMLTHSNKKFIRRHQGKGDVTKGEWTRNSIVLFACGQVLDDWAVNTLGRKLGIEDHLTPRNWDQKPIKVTWDGIPIDGSGRAKKDVKRAKKTRAAKVVRGDAKVVIVDADNAGGSVAAMEVDECCEPHPNHAPRPCRITRSNKEDYQQMSLL
ncbi:hypothetical protein HDV00_004272 [Rhizophlyctis rosea]|nr:hypothetical protein HDV00_004272 [Rhizophlyctis rosea]